MSSENALVKTWAAATQATRAAVEFAPKLASNLTVNVGLMIKLIFL
jgi:hypothetical protein